VIKLLPYPGDKRVRKYFAFWPVRINREIRWLEKVEIRQEYTEEPVHFMGRDLIREKWINKEFIKRGSK